MTSYIVILGVNGVKRGVILHGIRHQRGIKDVIILANVMLAFNRQFTLFSCQFG